MKLWLVILAASLLRPYRSFINTKACSRVTSIRNITSNAIYSEKLEVIKTDLLKELGLNTAPDMSHLNMNIPKAVVDGFWSSVKKQQTNDKVSLAKDLFIAGVIETFECSPADICVRFNHSTNPSQTISSITLWLNQQRKTGSAKISILTIKVFNQFNSKHVSMLKKLHIVEGGWISITIEELGGWLNGRYYGSASRLNVLVQITCKGCHVFHNNGLQPSIVLTLETKLNNRMKRETNACSVKSSSCCVDQFYVDFRLLKWDWIIAPTGFHAKQCQGSCRLLVPGKHQLSHAAGVGKTVAYREDKVRVEDFCCAPMELETLYILYINQDGYVIQEGVSLNAVTCACM